MAIPQRARRGRSMERTAANGHLDFQAGVMDVLDVLDALAAQRCADPRQDAVRRLYLGRLRALRPVQRAWQHGLEADVRRAEGFTALAA